MELRCEDCGISLGRNWLIWRNEESQPAGMVEKTWAEPWEMGNPRDQGQLCSPMLHLKVPVPVATFLFFLLPEGFLPSSVAETWSPGQHTAGWRWARLVL